MDYSLKLNKGDMIQTPKRLIIPHSMEFFLLSIVAILGLVGSIYIIASNAAGNSNNNYNQFATTPVVELEEDVDELGSSFGNYIKISGKKRVGNEIEFETKMDIKEKRYVMEMGDGMRMIITQPKFSYQYKEKGKYVLELKTIERGLITTIATKKLKIK